MKTDRSDNDRDNGSDNDSDRSSGGDVWEDILERERVNEGQVLLSYADAFRGLGLFDPTEQKLGRGAFGHVYRLGSKDAPTGALKITRDVYDAMASHALIGKTHLHLPKTLNVWSLDETFVDEWAGWYAIEREYLHPLDKQDTDLVEVLYQVYDNDNIRNLKIPMRHNRAMRDKWRVYVREILTESDSVHLLPRTMELLAKIGEGVQELAALGITWSDIHSDNIMRAGDNALKIADVGLCDLRAKIEDIVVPTLPATPMHLPRLSRSS